MSRWMFILFLIMMNILLVPYSKIDFLAFSSLLIISLFFPYFNYRKSLFQSSFIVLLMFLMNSFFLYVSYSNTFVKEIKKNETVQQAFNFKKIELKGNLAYSQIIQTFFKKIYQDMYLKNYSYLFFILLSLILVSSITSTSVHLINYTYNILFNICMIFIYFYLYKLSEFQYLALFALLLILAIIFIYRVYQHENY